MARKARRHKREYKCARCHHAVPWPQIDKHGEGKCLPSKIQKTRKYTR